MSTTISISTLPGTANENNGSSIALAIINFFKNIIIIAIVCGFSIACIVIGVLYKCNDDLSLFLIISGAHGLAFSTFKMLNRHAYPNDSGNGFVANIILFSSFAVALWGMFLVWPYQHNPCSKLVYGFAFASANLWWIMLIIAILLSILLISVADYDNSSIA